MSEEDKKAAAERHPHNPNPVTVVTHNSDGTSTKRHGLAGRLAHPPTKPIKFDNPPPLPGSAKGGG